MKKMMIFLILFLAIGFAAVSTTLILNGNILIGTNESDFDVYFSNAIIDDVENKTLISEDKKTINFETRNLSKVGDKSVLEYEVTNASTQYDANVSVTCTPKETELYKVINTQDKEIIEARTTGNGTVTVELKKNVLESQQINFTCTITASALEKEDGNTGTIVGSCDYEPGTEWDFTFSNQEDTFPIPCDGEYKLETWGAQGGTYSSTYYGGYGGYSVGNIKLTNKQTLFINVGGQPKSSVVINESTPGGYNGGGAAIKRIDCVNNAGGGATHIALSSGLLSTFNTKIDDILIVSGGGGGSGYYTTARYGIGGSGGGYNGENGIFGANSNCEGYGMGGSQTEPGSYYILPGHWYTTSIYIPPAGFGFGSDGDPKVGGSGGGGGLYGGRGTSCLGGGGGGSSYIGNSKLTNKIMYCYNCTTSTEESTRTETTNQVSPQPEANKAKQGNGYAKITLLNLK